jgi:hypothetical protein
MKTFFARLLGVALALVCFEAVVRCVYLSSSVWEAGYGFIIEPGSTVRWGREGHGTSHWTTNGVRGIAPRAELHPIVALGDSFTEGLQVDDDEVFPAVLERELRDRSLQIPVFNAGRSSASVADYIAFAPRYRQLFSPRWMLVELADADLLNDAWDPTKPHLKNDGVLSAEIVLPPPRGRIGSMLWVLRQRAMLVGLGFIRGGEFSRAMADEPPLFRAGSGTNTPKPPPAERPIEAELDLLFRTYDERVTIVWLSAFDPKKPLERTPIEVRVFAHCQLTGRSCVSIREGFPDLWKAGRAAYGHPNSNWNYGHMNADGHRLAATRAADELVRLSRDGLL